MSWISFSGRNSPDAAAACNRCRISVSEAGWIVTGVGRQPLLVEEAERAIGVHGLVRPQKLNEAVPGVGSIRVIGQKRKECGGLAGAELGDDGVRPASFQPAKQANLPGLEIG